MSKACLVQDDQANFINIIQGCAASSRRLRKRSGAALIKFYNAYGKICMTNDFFAGLVSAAVQNCYGVCGMATKGRADSMKAVMLGKDFPEKGVRVLEENGQLLVELHIKVTYGVNVAAVVKSISHKVRYAVEDATALVVRRVDVCVDDIV